MKYLRQNTCSEQSESNGFTLIEIMIAIVILSVALLSMASTTVTVIKGNQVSDNVTEAVALAQDTLEDLRNKNFYLGADGLLGPGDSNGDTADDSADNTIDAELTNDGDDIDVGTNVSANTALFTSPDNGGPVAISSTPQRVWNIADNTPIAGMKTVTVIVGWTEAGFNRFVAISTVIAGTRYSGMPGTI